MSPKLSPQRELWLLLTLAGIQFTHILDFMIMMPLGPQFTQVFRISTAEFGLLVSAYTLAAGLSGLLAATYIDRFDRKRLLLVLYVLFALATAACGLAPTYGTLMIARVAAGTFGGVLSSLSSTIVADVVPFDRRGRAMGIVMTSFSISTVAGVPIGLFLAAHISWHAPFFGIAGVSLLLAFFAALTLPVMREHLLQTDRPSVWGGIWQVLTDFNHLKAFALSVLIMLAGFTVIPYLTIFYRSNTGMQATQVPYIYLCGGIVTLLLSRFFGVLTDRWGKVPTFRLMSALAMVPMMAITLLGLSPLWLVLLVSSGFFACMSGRMIPGMALITSAANPKLRGTFMTLNSALQSAGMGIAAFIGGQLISRDDTGAVHHFWLAAAVGCIASLIAIALAGRLQLNVGSSGQKI